MNFRDNFSNGIRETMKKTILKDSNAGTRFFSNFSLFLLFLNSIF